MRRAAVIPALTLFVVASAGLAAPSALAANASGSSRIAPVSVRTLGDPTALPVTGSDNALHALYELAIVNTRGVPVQIDRMEVRGVAPRMSIVTFEGPPLVSRLRSVDGRPLTQAVLAPGEQVVMFVDIALFTGIQLPLLVDHRFSIEGRQFNLAAVNVDALDSVTLDTPVRGSNWVVLEGCCGPQSVARTTVYATEGGFATPGRFAIDLAQLDDEDRFANGDPAELTSYPSYGQYANAVAAGRVVEVISALPDQPPGTRPGTLTEETAQGNAVVVDLGRGLYVLYGGLKQGSVTVNKGAFVRKGQPVGQIGNSGDGTMPHLHLEVLSSPDRIAAQGVPFVLSSFGLAGRIDRARLLERGPTGSFTDSHFRVAQARSEQLPLDLTILDFESSSGSSGNPLL